MDGLAYGGQVRSGEAILGGRAGGEQGMSSE